MYPHRGMLIPMEKIKAGLTDLKPKEYAAQVECTQLKVSRCLFEASTDSECLMAPGRIFHGQGAASAFIPYERGAANMPQWEDLRGLVLLQGVRSSEIYAGDGDTERFFGTKKDFEVYP